MAETIDRQTPAQARNEDFGDLFQSPARNMIRDGLLSPVLACHIGLGDLKNHFE